MNKKLLLCLGVIVALCGPPSTAVAQMLESAVPRRSPGFSEPDAPPPNQSFNLAFLIAGAFDDNLIADPYSSSERVHNSGPYNSMVANADYAKRFRHGDLAFSGRSMLRYYPSLGDLVSAQHAASAGFSGETARTHLHLAQTYAYSPFFSFAESLVLFRPAAAPLPSGAAPDDAIVERDMRVSTSVGSLEHEFGRRLSASVHGMYEHTGFSEGVTSDRRSAGGGLARKLSRDLSLVAGYRYEEEVYHYRSPERAADNRLHNIDLGLAYMRRLGRTRRTTLGFTSGSALIQDAANRSRNRLTGDARLNREIGRTWHVTGGYRRGVGFIAGLPGPYLADSLAVDIGGNVARRVELGAESGFSRGDMGFGGSDATTLDRWSGSARMRLGLSRSAALSAEYVFFRCFFDPTRPPPAGLPPKLERQGVRIGFDFRFAPDR